MKRGEAKLNLEWVHTDRATVYSNIDKIYDEFEAQLKAKDEEIDSLKNLINDFNNTYSVGDFDFGEYYRRLKDTN